MLVAPEDLEPWHLYTASEITHFEALRRIFTGIRADEAALDEVMRAMTIDPELGPEIGHNAGWDVVVVSNGCQSWLACHLEETGYGCRAYEVWSDVARTLVPR